MRILSSISRKNETKIEKKIDEVLKSLNGFQSVIQENRGIREKNENLRKDIEIANKTIENQKNEMEDQKKILDGIMEKISGFSDNVRIIQDNKDIIENIIEIIKESKKFILIFTHLINAEERKENKKLNEMFGELKNKVKNGKLSLVCIRYHSHSSETEMEKTTKHYILSRLNGSSLNCLDVDAIENLHFKLIMNEKSLLIFSNNIDETSFKEENNEIGILINNSELLRNLREILNKKYNIEIPKCD